MCQGLPGRAFNRKWRWDDGLRSSESRAQSEGLNLAASTKRQAEEEHTAEEDAAVQQEGEGSAGASSFGVGSGDRHPCYADLARGPRKTPWRAAWIAEPCRARE